ncbi:hypothetical protein LPC08_17465 [Roseomonas sp. OT10]|uniref:hypothetical protein n=1 Tax=Roseomonas cutis TaxID=2897332 RepID=UPI001E62B3C6|nr:hypothetical protein [Roseomonas sp. OT10]UFN47789.1 hypothetical protein LPC08_17465 [Roseomonas sp. OT10]
MNPIGSGSALIVFATAKEAQEARAAIDAAAPPLQAGGIAQGASGGGSGTFTTRELGQILSALSPAVENQDENGKARFVGDILANLSARRSAGEATFMVAAFFPGGASIISMRSPSELAAALASDDPGSLGSFIDNDGTAYFVRDMLREALGMQTGPTPGDGFTAWDSRDAIAAAIAEMLADAAEKEGEGLAAIRATSKPADLGGMAGGGVGIVSLAARAPTGTSPPGSPLLLDLAV